MRDLLNIRKECLQRLYEESKFLLQRDLFGEQLIIEYTEHEGYFRISYSDINTEIYINDFNREILQSTLPILIMEFTKEHEIGYYDSNIDKLIYLGISNINDDLQSTLQSRCNNWLSEIVYCRSMEHTLDILFPVMSNIKVYRKDV